MRDQHSVAAADLQHDTAYLNDSACLSMSCQPGYDAR